MVSIAPKTLLNLNIVHQVIILIEWAPLNANNVQLATSLKQVQSSVNLLLQDQHLH